jgi:hypothetical protein
MQIDIADQRKDRTTSLSIDPEIVSDYCKLAGVDPAKVRIRVRDEQGAYGYTRPVAGGYRVVINIRYGKPQLSIEAAYVVSNTLLHELRHCGQGEERGWSALSGDYQGWSEVEAREVGRSIKGQTERYAIR